MSKRGLGKGLDALIPGAGAFGARAIQEIDINSIKVNPLQPRTQMDEEGLEDLANSIRVHGVLQPLLVRKAEEGFELIAGERRWRAARRAVSYTHLIKERGNPLLFCAASGDIKRPIINFA